MSIDDAITNLATICFSSEHVGTGRAVAASFTPDGGSAETGTILVFYEDQSVEEGEDNEKSQGRTIEVQLPIAMVGSSQTVNGIITIGAVSYDVIAELGRTVTFCSLRAQRITRLESGART